MQQRFAAMPADETPHQLFVRSSAVVPAGTTLLSKRIYFVLWFSIGFSCQLTDFKSRHSSKPLNVVRHSVKVTKLPMTFRLLLFSFIVFISSNVVGQITLKNPQICHDGEGYLKCCYDGSYILKFDKGNFKTFSSFDSNLKYSDIDKTLTFYSVDPIDESRDTVQIRLQPHSILITNGKLQKEITSFPSTPSSFDDFHVSPYIVDGVGRGLTFWAGCGRYVVVKV